VENRYWITKKNCRLPFGAYAQVHDDLGVTNSMLARTTGVLNLGPTRNIQGTHKFLSLQTREVIVRRKWTELPVPEDVIDRLKDILGESGKIDLHGDEDCEERNVENTNEEDKYEVSQDMEQINVDQERESAAEIEPEVQSAEGEIEEGILQESTPMTTKLVEKQYELNHRYDLRPSQNWDYSHCFTFVSVKVGLQRWRERELARH
jgi:hypothetical protein